MIDFNGFFKGYIDVEQSPVRTHHELLKRYRADCGMSLITGSRLVGQMTDQKLTILSQNYKTPNIGITILLSRSAVPARYHPDCQGTWPPETYLGGSIEGRDFLFLADPLTYSQGNELWLSDILEGSEELYRDVLSAILADTRLVYLLTYVRIYFYCSVCIVSCRFCL